MSEEKGTEVSIQESVFRSQEAEGGTANLRLNQKG